ncbi:bifunctional lysylphosphatidylglycerol synthetase/lysine--tRNA ligase LysX [Schaalia sp. Marseille-Q2122]|uniref:bifunctional lysylphosphatidylglycerol synthetase/lysine--tRNA ligase LysX n=1 Tax=Schaalia sp. Marseille-Q2122 TaxID=2736604 RepID=UPI00158E0DC2|nr:bifunctional lysylphosphatidylglycerol synthetase/lysine--tRNA ligase LysX [Schaalia sp. Marseille-Q2122]
MAKPFTLHSLKNSTKNALPDWIGWASFIAAGWSVVELFLAALPNSVVDVVGVVFDLFNVIHGPSLFLAAIMFIVGTASFRRKRFIVPLLIFIQAIVLVSNALFLAFVGIEAIEGVPTSFIVQIWANSVISVALVALIVWARDSFPAPVHARSAKTAFMRLLIGSGIVLVTAFVTTWLFPGDLKGAGAKALWALQSATGYSSLISSAGVPAGGNVLLASFLSLASLVVLVVSLHGFLRAQGVPARSAAEDQRLHYLLARFPADSLDYFATGNRRAVVFSPDSQAAVSYAVSSGVAMAGGDPIGDPASWDSAISTWMKAMYAQGLTPGVMSTSERGARAYKNAGFTLRAMGDEAVIEVPLFNLSEAAMRPLAAAKRRVARAGVEIACRPLSALTDEELATLSSKAALFREGDERGFSMALDRIMNRLDGDQMIVTAHTPDGELDGMLTFVPWGRKGLSLNLMRRNPRSTNGVVEAMVLALIDHCRDVGVDRISLNFAMFRNAFIEGDAVDATWGQRLLRRMMMLASRVWQLESLYEANARYNPTWTTRYLGFVSPAQLTATLIAAARLEGFLPAWGEPTPELPAWLGNSEHVATVAGFYADAARVALPPQRLNDQQRTRHLKAQRLMEAGMDPYPPGDPSVATTPLSTILTNVEGLMGANLVCHARVEARRHHGRLRFLDVFEGNTSLQVHCAADSTEHYDLLGLVDVGDAIEVRGHLGRSDTGELTLFASSWRMLAKTLRPVNPPRQNVDRTTLARHRSAELIHQPRSLELLQMRSRATAAIRECLNGRGYLEVETPILHAVKGGANARPFVTHLNAYNCQVTLRIAPELYLKRLMVGGMTAVYEIGRSFRNEGVDRTHNPEFTSLEAYEAGADYVVMREMTEELIRSAARRIHGREVVWQPREIVERCAANPLPGTPELKVTTSLPLEVPRVADAPIMPAAQWAKHRDVFTASADLVEVDLSEPWPVVSVCEGISRVTGRMVSMDSSPEALQALCRAEGIEVAADASVASMINELYEELVEPRTGYPTFYTDFPAEGCPLTRIHREDPRLAERWDLVAFGMEIGTAYTELTDPRDQRERFIAQSLAAAAGDPEAMSVDEEFLDSLELGMVPTGGMGMGVDRMVMLLCGTDIRDVIAFPFVRPLNGN